MLPLAGHKDSVTCTVFSHDSKLVATGDMSGLITVWDVATQKEVWNFETTDLEVKLQTDLFHWIVISWAFKNFEDKPSVLHVTVHTWGATHQKRKNWMFSLTSCHSLFAHRKIRRLVHVNLKPRIY